MDTKIVAITGGIASGKSTVGKMLEDMGFLVIDSDKISREICVPGSDAMKEIEEEFGSYVILESGELDRKALASIVFGDSEKRKKLESILHPKIGAEWRRRAAESGREWVFALIPLLFEAGLEHSVHLIWVCTAPEEIRIRRAVERDGSTYESVKSRIDSQMPDDVKVKRADLVIDTSGTIDNVKSQVEEAVRKLWSGHSAK